MLSYYRVVELILFWGITSVATCDRLAAEDHKEALERQFDSTSTSSATIDQRIMIRAELIEVRADEIKRLGLEFQSFDGEKITSVPVVEMIESNTPKLTAVPATFSGFINALLLSGVIKSRLACDVTVENLFPASFFINTEGGQTLIGQRDGMRGEVELAVVPSVLADGRFGIHIRSSQGPANAANKDKKPSSETGTFKCTHTSIDITSSESVFLTGFMNSRHKTPKSGNTSFALLISAAIVDSAPPHPGSSSR